MAASGSCDEARPFFPVRTQTTARQKECFPKDHVHLDVVIRIAYPQVSLVMVGKGFVSPQIFIVSRAIVFLRLLGPVSVDINSLPPTAPSGVTWLFLERRTFVLECPVGRLGIRVPKYPF